MKKKVIEILNEYLDELTDGNFTRGIIYEENIEDIAEDVVELYKGNKI